jgi:hypothetical protein
VLRSACAAIAAFCGIARGALIGGCDPPQPATIAAATQLLSAKRLRPEILMASLLKPAA